MSGPGCTRQECPVCGVHAAVFTAWLAAPGYGQAGRCTSCGIPLWRANASGRWHDDRDEPPHELSPEDVR